MALTLLNLQTEPMSAIKARQKAAVKQSRRIKRPQLVRGYEGGGVNRLTADWVPAQTTANYDLRMSLRYLRARSRHLAHNDCFKRFLSLCRTHIVGRNGIACQVRFAGENVTQPEINKARFIQKQWETWGKAKNCTLSHKLSWTEVQRLYITTMARDGEVLVRKIWTDDNSFGFALKFYDVAWLDETFNREMPNGNRIIMSIEVDKNDRTVAYWLTPPRTFLDNPDRFANAGAVRVPANEIIHEFLLTEDEAQTRGVPWMYAGMIKARNLDAAEEAELVAYRAGASKMGFYKKTGPGDDLFGDGEDEDGDELPPVSPADLFQYFEAGTISELPENYDFVPFDPKFPESATEAFSKRMLRRIAAAVDVSYHTLTGDLESVNYSSGRLGSLEERDLWRTHQQFMAEKFCQEVFGEWLLAAWLNGVVNLTTDEFERVREPQWRGRGWDWVDPTKDVNSSVLALDNNLTTLTDVLAEKGITLEQFFETRKAEIELAKKYGFDLSRPNSASISPNDSPPKEKDE